MKSCMINDIKNKLNSNSGESLSEVLITAVVISLAMILFVSMLSAAARLVDKSETHFHDNIEEKNQIEAMSGKDKVTITIRGTNDMSGAQAAAKLIGSSGEGNTTSDFEFSLNNFDASVNVTASNSDNGTIMSYKFDSDGTGSTAGGN